MILNFAHPNFVYVGILGIGIYFCHYFSLLKRSGLFTIKSNNQSSYSFKILRSFVFLIGFVGWLFLTYSMMGPRVPSGFGNDSIKVNDIYIVLDLSRSMTAIDFKPSRFEAATSKMKEFVKLFSIDRIGIITFAEKVFTMLPLTTDTELIKKMIDQIKIGPLGDGTNIGDALALAVGRLLQSNAKTKVIVLLTDGVSNVGTLTPLQSAEMAKDKGIKIYTVGIGTDGDALMPIGKNMFGSVEYQTIPGGSFDEKGLMKIADITNGKYFSAKTSDGLMKIMQEINKLERTEVTHTGKTIYRDLFYNYFLIGFILICLSELMRRFVMREIC